jgi:hypothetical protein
LDSNDEVEITGKFQQLWTLNYLKT